MRLKRRLSIPVRLLMITAVLSTFLGLASPYANAQDSAPQADDDIVVGSFIDVIKVNGLLDPIMVDFIERSVGQANATGANALVLQVDTGGAVVSDTRITELVDVIASSQVPVDIWIGPSGAEMSGAAAQLVGVAHDVGMAPGTRVGNAGFFNNANLDQARLEPIRDRSIGFEEARELGVTTLDAPTIGDLVVQLPGVTTVEVTKDGETRLEPVTQARFGQLSFVSQFMHAVASPAVTYLLLIIGLGLIVFELFTAGVGVAGVVGAGSFVLSWFGLATLPTNWWGIALIFVSMAAFAVDVQTGVPRLWTVVGAVTFIAGSLTLYDGVELSVVSLIVGIVGILLAFLLGMPSMVRSRFSTPALGRGWLMGEAGRATTPIDPTGVVQLRGALWRAFTDEEHPIDELERVRVCGVEGLVVKVELDTGTARGN